MASLSADEIAKVVLDKFEALPGRGKPNTSGRDWTVLAGIVAEDDSSEELRVLSLATGTRCVGSSSMAAGQGRVVLDCHAEVLCRRALQVILLTEIRSGATANADSAAAPGDSILERYVGMLKWRLRPSVRLHFYVSALPCGECTLVPISSAKEGTLKRRQCDQDLGADSTRVVRDWNRTGAKPAEGMPEDPKGRGIEFHVGGVLRYKSGRSDLRPEARSVSYSCSEKLCRWNRIGWQGGLLSRFIPEPLVMQTVVIGGSLFDANFVSSALYGRGLPPYDLVAKSTPRAPLFCNASLPFRFDRELLECCAADSVAKVSTAGLCVVWADLTPNSSRGSFPNSISPKVKGFYDVLVGHTGERHCAPTKSLGGATEDRQVSPLCKVQLAKELVETLVALCGSEDEAVNWLLQRVGGESRASALGALSTDSILPPTTKRLRCDRPLEMATSTQDIVVVPPPLSVPTYAWLKACAADPGYLERRRIFHVCEPFVHWRRKSYHKESTLAAADAFPLPLPLLTKAAEIHAEKSRLPA